MKEEGRRKKDEGRRKREEGRGMRDEGERNLLLLSYSPTPLPY
jgi:hypothetical protein